MRIFSALKTHKVSVAFGVLIALTVLAFAAAVVVAWPSLSYLVDSLFS